MSGRIQWLHGEIEAWLRDGLIAPDLAERLRGRYPPSGRGSRSAALIGFAVLGALLLGGGIILLLAHNWSDLSRPMRTAIALAPLVAAQLLALAGALRGADGPAWREGIGVFWTLTIGAAIAMVGQIYNLSGSYDAFMLTWLLLALPVVHLLRSSLSAVLCVAGALAWTAPHAGDLPRVLGYWPLTLAVAPLLLRGSRRGVFTSGLALLRWALTASIFAGLGLTLVHALPGLWMVTYASLLSVLFLVDLLLLRGAPSLWHRPMRVAGTCGCALLSLMLTYEWPWRQIGWRHWRAELPPWQQVVDAAVALALMGGAVALSAVLRRRIRAADAFPAIFFLVALAGYFLTAQWEYVFLSLLLFNLFVFAYGVALLAAGVRRGSLAGVNAGMFLLAAVVALRFFDSDMSLVARGVVFVLLGAVFLSVNVFLARRFRGAS